MNDINYNYYATLDDISEYGYIIMKDQVTGYRYVVSMRNGSLTSQCKCSSISVVQPPEKINYIEGEAFDPTGMVVMCSYDDGLEKEITNYTYSDISNDGVVTITYTEAGVEYNVDITVALTLMSKLLVDFEYIRNEEDNTYTLTAWKGTLNGEPSTEMFIPNNNLIIVEV